MGGGGGGNREVIMTRANLYQLRLSPEANQGQGFL